MLRGGWDGIIVLQTELISIARNEFSNNYHVRREMQSVIIMNQTSLLTLTFLTASCLITAFGEEKETAQDMQRVEQS